MHRILNKSRNGAYHFDNNKNYYIRKQYIFGRYTESLLVLEATLELPSIIMTQKQQFKSHLF